MGKTTFFSKEQQARKIGQKQGPSKYITVSQDMISQFGDLTLDQDPMHQDPEWCEKHSPFGVPIAYGFLTISLLTALVHDLTRYDKDGHLGSGGFPLNYGFNKLRLIKPILANSRVCATIELVNVEEKGPGQLLQTTRIVVNIEGEKTPALVADWLSLWVSEELN